jgi:AraC-like DNA-binding protein
MLTEMRDGSSSIAFSSRGGASLETTARMDARIARTLALIEAHIDQQWTVPRFAAAAGLSPSRFMHVFRRVMGMSPGQYLQERRMVRARALLERTFVSVGEAMQRVGCRDPSHFARNFRRHHGFPPSACRVFGRPRRAGPDYNVGP